VRATDAHPLRLSLQHRWCNSLSALLLAATPPACVAPCKGAVVVRPLRGDFLQCYSTDCWAAWTRRVYAVTSERRDAAVGRFRPSRHNLGAFGRDDLADKVRWTSVQDGAGAAYDIASFEPDGRDRVIEVKTTTGANRTRFHISRNEIAVAESRSDDWHLMRVWNFAREPRAFALRPPLDTHVELTATSFLASLR
jgi:Domain of unknown function (DUF3883)